MKKVVQVIDERKKQIIVAAMITFFFFAPYSVSNVIQKITPVPTSVLVSFLVASVLLLIFLLSKPKNLFENIILEKKLIMISMFLIPIISVFAAFYNAGYMHSVEYLSYIKQSLPTRIINLGFFFIIFYVFNKNIQIISDNSLLRVTKAYLFSIFLIILFGIWQFLYFTAGIPILDVNTRSFVHSVEEDVLFNFRLTSFIDEPSYLVPLLIEALIIGFVVYSKKLKLFSVFFALPALFVLFFSFSVSGFANLGLVVLFGAVVLFTTQIKNKRRLLLFVLVILAGLIIGGFIFQDTVHQLLMPIIGRFDTLFDIQQHSRLYQTVMPFFWLFDYSFVNALFGFGPGSYEFIHMTKFLHYEVPVSTTSNNMWVDLLFEYGIVGFLTFLVTFIYILFRFYKRRNENKYFLFSLILWFHLGITSLYRSDFAAPRFWAVIAIVWVLYELGVRRALKKEIS